MNRVPILRPRHRIAARLRAGTALAGFLALAFAAGGATAQDKPGGAKLNLGDFRVFEVDQPITGRFRFEDPATGETREMVLREEKPGSARLAGFIDEGKVQVLTLTASKEGVGYEGTLSGLFDTCGQARVPVTDLLPLGDQLILRVDADPPTSPCPYLENPERARLIVAPTSTPVRLLEPGEISSARTRSQIGLEGQRKSGGGSPILASTVLMEGGTELKYVGRTRGLDGSVWIQVETLVSPAPGVDPPRGFLRPGQLRVAATITFQRLKPSDP